MGIQIEDGNALIDSLRALPRETDWVEFKENNFNADTVGQYISSLANSAILHEKDHAYLVYGIRDSDHEVVGTHVNIDSKMVGNDRFLFWVVKFLEPHLQVQHHRLDYHGKQVELLCIQPPYQQPVRFKKVAYIRVAAAQQPLTNHPEIERAIWAITSRYSFEATVTESNVTVRHVLEGYDYKKLLSLLKKPNESIKGAVDHMQALGLLQSNLQQRFDVKALAGMTCAENMNAISLLERKGVRVITFKGKDKLEVVGEAEGQRGYTVAFEALMRYIMERIPHSAVMKHGVRTTEYKIPEPTIREFVANALIHQDFTKHGERPTIEIYSDKVRVINPGTPLVETDRFIDTPSKSRNPRFAALMRAAGLCEELGSGVDRALREIERASLPPPLIQSVEGSTIVTVFMDKPFAVQTPEDRVRACYQHACLMHEQGDQMSNASLRLRFGLSDKQYPQISRVIQDAIGAGRIRPLNDDQANRVARYLPYWA
jgi:predicted HTH transcriptional regulator